MVGFRHKKKEKKDEEKRITTVTQENIEAFLQGIDKSIEPLTTQSPDKLNDPLRKECNIWFENTVNIGKNLDANSFKIGAVYGLYRYMQTLKDKTEVKDKKSSYVV